MVNEVVRFAKSLLRGTVSPVIESLKLPSPLAPSPFGPPKYAVSIEGRQLADPRATRVLLALMNQHAVIGGAAAHWGGPAAFAEIMSALHGIMFSSKEWYEHYNFVNDAGHTENGIYALRANYGFAGLTFDDLKGFRSLESKLTGHGESHVNPQGVLISNGPLGSGLSVAQGLAMADTRAKHKRLTICTISDGGMMEGEAKEALAAIPGLWKQGLLKGFLLIVSDNNTKLSGRIDQDSFSMGPSFAALEALGWDLSVESDGHHLPEVYKCLEKAMNSALERPVALVFKTVKGKGVRQTEESASGGHGYPLKAYDPGLLDFLRQIYGNEELPREFANWAEDILQSKPTATAASGAAKLKAQVGIGRAAIRAAKEGMPVFSLSADLQGSTGMAPFHKEFPESFVDLGVAEANMISTAAGFSKQGFIPIVDTFSQFGITKGNLPLMMANLSQAPVIAIFTHTGFQDAADGASHQATTYFSCISGIPHTVVLNCSCAREAEDLLYMSLKKFQEDRLSGRTPESVILFMGRESFPEKLPGGEQLTWGKAQVLREGSDLTIAASGPMIWQALEARSILQSEGIAATVMNSPFVNRVDVPTFQNCLERTKNRLITLEDHQLIAGQGAMIAHALSLGGVSVCLKSLGVKGSFGRSAYKSIDLYKHHGLDAAAVVAAAREF